MAHFRGTIQGNRGQASRLGSKDSGLRVEAQSWQGKVVVVLGTKDGIDTAYVTLQQHSNGKGHRGLVLYDGPVAGMPEVSKTHIPQGLLPAIDPSR